MYKAPVVQVLWVAPVPCWLGSSLLFFWWGELGPPLSCNFPLRIVLCSLVGSEKFPCISCPWFQALRQLQSCFLLMWWGSQSLSSSSWFFMPALFDLLAGLLGSCFRLVFIFGCGCVSCLLLLTHFFGSVGMPLWYSGVYIPLWYYCWLPWGVSWWAPLWTYGLSRFFLIDLVSVRLFLLILHESFNF